MYDRFTIIEKNIEKNKYVNTYLSRKCIFA